MTCCDSDFCNDGGYLPADNDQMEAPDYSYEALDISNQPVAERSMTLNISITVYFIILSFFY